MQITGKKPHFVEADLRDRGTTEQLFTDNPITAAIHFAALKSVGESVAKPVEYYANNLGGLLTLYGAPRRPGDIASCYADPGLAAELLGWRAEKDLRAMCEDSWRWQSLNPKGFDA